MNIEKVKNTMNSYDFYLTKDDKTLKIHYSGNLDLYLMLSNDKLLSIDKNTIMHFDITKENYEIFQLFDSLYKDIISGNIFKEDIYIYKEFNSYDYTKSYEYRILVDDDHNIVWISDDGPVDLEDALKISKIDDDTYRLYFFRNDKSLDFGFKSSTNISVRIRNSGSRYNPFNCLFMRMFQELQNINPDYHQIHLEEIEYIKKLKKK